VNSVALAAAHAALSDREFVEKSAAMNFRGMKQITEGLRRLGVEYIPSFANFVSFRVSRADSVYQQLLRRGVIVRPIATYGMPEHLRVSIGLEIENERFLQALAASL
jgi:histidinol-phosphate aminotransferase